MIHNFYFKLTHTGNTFIKELDSETPLDQIRVLIDSNVRTYFRIELYEIVLAGTPQLENGPRLLENPERKLIDLLGEKINHTAFYIRPVSGSVIGGQTLQRNFDCAICLESRPESQRTFLTCSHSFCAGCINRWEGNETTSSQRHNYCPLCRQLIQRSN